MTRPTRYNDDKPHRCPACHAIANTEYPEPARWRTRLRWWLDDQMVRFWRLHYRHPVRELHRALSNLLDPGPVGPITLASVTCCRCGVEFTRWPWLPLLKRRGVTCTECHPAIKE